MRLQQAVDVGAPENPVELQARHVLFELVFVGHTATALPENSVQIFDPSLLLLDVVDPILQIAALPAILLLLRTVELSNIDGSNAVVVLGSTSPWVAGLILDLRLLHRLKQLRLFIMIHIKKLSFLSPLLGNLPSFQEYISTKLFLPRRLH